MYPRVHPEAYKRMLDKVSEMDFARLAAFIDGEGCIGISSSNQRGRMAVRQHSLIVTVTNTDLRLFRWLTKTFGGSWTNANTNGNLKVVYRWLLNEAASEEILRRCLPYFIIKHEQAEIALIYRDMRNERRKSKRNQRVTPEELASRDELQERISALNSSKGFGVVKFKAQNVQ